ncbi:ABC transporter ATP-binding protein [Clostridium cylindrosporum]|uniref:ABC-type antimicrobial peptide transport system, ATPase component n=1 Tax=Clostridium cylindrosporum DSM 605 TaxID=1121307 RepID=A0A0J8DE76_CLOCY|nr:ABC transporter ATP-binding protein [Clostridium cylindrosporum]KMT22509.1 ABC-type antimicrobial peptide transport system, ATPase component [Clostridium cylindrosporum DSM 605]
MEVCRLENVSKTYKMGETVCPLKNISLKVSSGDFLSIEGPSGIGKSTLLYIIGGLLNLDEGKLYIEDKDVSLLSDRELTTLRGEKIGFIFQDSNLLQALTLQENLEFAQRISNKGKCDTRRIDELLERLGLSERKGFLPHSLSGGQRRRAVVARALINNPKLILADEPTNDLDEKYAAEVISLLEEATKAGSAVIMVTHNTKWAERANIRYRINDGILEII